MKLLRLIAVAYAAFFVVPAQAQTSGTVTNHAFAIGKGPGQTGFTSLLCAATQLAVGQSAANPACKALSGDITMDADGVTAIGANKVTNGMLRQSGALSLIGRSANSTGNVADISAVAGSGCAYREASNVIGCGELATAALGANIVTNAKMAQMANGTTKCRTTAGTGNAEDCTASQMRSLLSLVVGTNVQGWDADLDALAAMTGTGIVRRTGAATFTTGTAVANSELATMANNTFKGNVSGSTATPLDLTASQILDSIGSTRGAILVRGASGWSLLSPGTSGFVLTSNGAGADPTYQASTGGGGLSDTDRRNALLTLIYQSKLFAGYRRVINQFAAGFKSSDGINTGSSSNYTVDTANGLVKPTTSQTQFTNNVAIGNMTGGGGLAAGFDGNTNQSQAASAQGLINGDTTLGQDWGSGVTRTVGRFKIYGPNNSGILNTVTLSYDIQGSNDNSTWTTIYSGTIPSANSTVVDVGTGIDTSTAYRYHRFRGTGNGVNAMAVAELQFFPVATTNSMTVVTTAQTSDASVSNGRALLEFDNSAAPTLDTDLTVEVTCNGGTNWASAALTAVTSNSQGGRKVAETADTACTAGTSFAARIKTLNNKSVPIYGVSLTVH